MYERVRYSGEFEDVFKKIYDLKERIIYWQNKTGKPLSINTHFFFNIEDDHWEGEFEIIYEREL